MLTRSRSGHLKSKQGCSQQHALHLAEEAKKQEEQKQKRIAFLAKNPQKTPGGLRRPKPPQKRQNRVLRGCKCAVGVDRGISDSPRQLVNQLQRDTACSTTDSR